MRRLSFSPTASVARIMLLIVHRKGLTGNRTKCIASLVVRLLPDAAPQGSSFRRFARDQFAGTL